VRGAEVHHRFAATCLDRGIPRLALLQAAALPEAESHADGGEEQGEQEEDGARAR